MIKKISIATGVFAISALVAATMTFAQTTPSTTKTTVTPIPSVMTKTIPAKAPATGRAN